MGQMISSSEGEGSGPIIKLAAAGFEENDETFSVVFSSVVLSSVVLSWVVFSSVSFNEDSRGSVTFSVVFSSVWFTYGLLSSATVSFSDG